MKIAVCLIVYNGDPYISKWLNHYLNCPYIDYVCVAEGATFNMVTALSLETPRSTDNTIQELKKHESDPKLRFVCAPEPYPEKMEQQNTYVDLLPEDTDYIWVADVDEFYHYHDMKIIRKLLSEYGYTFVEFRPYHFWKNPYTVAVGGTGWGYDQPFDRIFKYYPGAHFIDHRPIAMLDRDGNPMKKINPLLGNDNPVRLYHYSYITRKMVYEKMLYYSITFNRDYINNWFKPVWESWTEQTREYIESNFSIHPTVKGGKTMQVELFHPIDISDIY